MKSPSMYTPPPFSSSDRSASLSSIFTSSSSGGSSLTSDPMLLSNILNPAESSPFTVYSSSPQYSTSATPSYAYKAPTSNSTSRLPALEARQSHDRNSVGTWPTQSNSGSSHETKSNITVPVWSYQSPPSKSTNSSSSHQEWNKPPPPPTPSSSVPEHQDSTQRFAHPGQTPNHPMSYSQHMSTISFNETNDKTPPLSSPSQPQFQQQPPPQFRIQPQAQFQMQPSPQPPTSKPKPKAPHPNTPYTQEQVDFIHYARETLGQGWSICLQEFQEQFPLQKTVPAIQGRWYRHQQKIFINPKDGELMAYDDGDEEEPLTKLEKKKVRIRDRREEDIKALGLKYELFDMEGDEEKEERSGAERLLGYKWSIIKEGDREKARKIINRRARRNAEKGEKSDSRKRKSLNKKFRQLKI